MLSSGQTASPETQFDYANPQRYFEQMRQRQMQQGTQQQGATGAVSSYPGSTLDTAQPPSPTGTPTATGTSARPGIAHQLRPGERRFEPIAIA